MCVANPGDVLTGSPVLHGQSGLIDHLPSPGSDDVSPQQPVGLLVSQDLHQAVRVVVTLGSAVRGEGEFANRILDSLRLEILLVLTDPGNLWVGVDDAGDAVVVDVDGTSHHALAGNDGLVLRLVGQHRPGYTVAYSVDIGQDRLEPE